MRVAIYTRVSDPRESSIDMQLSVLRPYAAAQGWEVSEFTDDCSGGTLDRPGLKAMEIAAFRRTIDAVLVWKVDRLTRNCRDLLNTIEEWRCYGVQFFSYTEQIDITTPIGRAMLAVLGAMAQLERETTRERIRAGMKHAKAEGKELGRRRSIFRRDEAVRMHQAGKSLREIGAALGVSYQTIRNSLKSV